MAAKHRLYLRGDDAFVSVHLEAGISPGMEAGAHQFWRCIGKESYQRRTGGGQLAKVEDGFRPVGCDHAGHKVELALERVAARDEHGRTFKDGEADPVQGTSEVQGYVLGQSHEKTAPELDRLSAPGGIGARRCHVRSLCVRLSESIQIVRLV